MSVFAKMLVEKVQIYIELRRSLGYAFEKQAATLRAFVRYVESEQLGGPLTKGMALNFVLSFAGTLTVEPPVRERSAAFANISPSTTRGPKRLIAAHFPGPAPFHRRAS
jgi:hypothetical protein